MQRLEQRSEAVTVVARGLLEAKMEMLHSYPPDKVHCQYCGKFRNQANFDEECPALLRAALSLTAAEVQTERAERKRAEVTPEGCWLIAFDTGEGWALAVEDEHRNTVAYLAWPKVWPERVTRQKLWECGFEVL